MNSSTNYEEIRQQVLQLTDEERKRLLAEVADAAPVTINSQDVPLKKLQLDWLADKANREQYGGHYVALRENELIAHSPNSREVIAAAKAAGMHPLFIAWVEPLTEETGTLIGWQ